MNMFHFRFLNWQKIPVNLKIIMPFISPVCCFAVQKLLSHLNQVSSSHPKERFDLYHKLQTLFDKWMFHLRYAVLTWTLSVVNFVLCTELWHKFMLIVRHTLRFYVPTFKLGPSQRGNSCPIAPD